MKKPSYLIRLLILGLLLCSPIGFTQLGWYLYGKETGINIGMVTGTIAVVIVAYLMYQMGWREEDQMLTVGFITLSVTAMLIVLYLGLSSVRRGLEAKNNSPSRKSKIVKKAKPKSLTNELDKLNKLHQEGALTKNEFNKAKAKLLKN